MGRERFSIGLHYIRTQWRSSILFFFVIFAFFLGIAFLLAPFAPTGVNYGIYHVWGDGGLVVFGIAYLALALWSIFWPEGPGGVLTTAALALIGLTSSLPPIGRFVNITGIIFYLLILGTIGTPFVRVHVGRHRRRVT